jgi:hypothetical protein
MIGDCHGGIGHWPIAMPHLAMRRGDAPLRNAPMTITNLTSRITNDLCAKLTEGLAAM